jgi:hypothetical protein
MALQYYSFINKFYTISEKLPTFHPRIKVSYILTCQGLTEEGSETRIASIPLTLPSFLLFAELQRLPLYEL